MFNPVDAFVQSCLINAALSGGLGAFVLARPPLRRPNVLWALFCICVALWAFGLGMMVDAENPIEAGRWLRWVHYGGANFIPVFFFHFTCLFAHRTARRTLYAGYALAILLHVLNLAGFMAEAQPMPPFNYYTTAKPAYALFVAYFFSFVGLAHVYLISAARGKDPVLANQSRYVMVGSAIGFIGGSTAFFPVFRWNIFPYGILGVSIYIFVVTYAIIKHRLLEISVVVRRTLIYSAVTVLLTLAYVGMTLFLAGILQGWVGRSSTVSSVGAAIAIAVLFHPLRLRIERWVNSRFSRESLDQRLLREATGGFVHEIKKPLANISLPAQLALQDLDCLERGDFGIKDAAMRLRNRLTYIIKESHEAGAKMEAIRSLLSAAGPDMEEVDLNSVLEKALASEQDRLDRFSIQVESRLMATRRVVRGNSRQLEIAILNLLKNAIDALSDASVKSRQLQMSTRNSEDEIIIELADSGVGVPADVLSKLFSGNFTSKPGVGMGIGLFLSKEIIRLHGGDVSLDSTVGKGTVFRVRLPIGNVKM